MKNNDPILAHILAGTSHNIKDLPFLAPGHSAIVNKGNTWRPYLIYLVRTLFNIQRYGNCPERDFDIDEDFYSKLNSSHYEKSLTELKSLYEYTQKFLRTDYFSEKFRKNIEKPSSIKLARGIRDIYGNKYVNNIVYLKTKAERYGQSFFKVPTDIILFFAAKPYVGDLNIYVEVPFEDILIYDEAILLEDLVTPYVEKEFIVINRNPDGCILINTEDVSYNAAEVKPIEPQGYVYKFYLSNQRFDVTLETLYPPIRFLQKFINKIDTFIRDLINNFFAMLTILILLAVMIISY
jgi:hypothetical protein